MAEKPQKNTFMKKMVSAYFKRKSLETKANMNETDMLADVSTVGNETMAEYEDLLMDETKTETIVEEKSSDYDDGEVTFKLPQTVKEHSSDELPKPEITTDKRDRDEKLAERLQKKLVDPASPSNSPMVKKLKHEDSGDNDTEQPVPVPKGAYNMDFDKFDDPNFNPFETKTKVVDKFDDNDVAITPASPPTDVKEEPVAKEAEEVPVKEEPNDELNELNATFDAPKRKPPVLGKNRKSNAAVKKTTPTKKTPVPSTPKEEDEAPPPPKGAYNMDFDKFDDPNFNPFETKTKVVDKFDEPAAAADEAPLPAKGAYNMDFDKFDDPDFNPFETKTKVVDKFDAEPAVVAAPAPAEEVVTKPDEVAEVAKDEPSNELNTTFEPPKRKPPTLGKNRKPIKKKVAAPKPKPTPAPAPADDGDAPPPKGAYAVDFDKFDDPDFNPFETKSKVENKPVTMDDEMPLPKKGGYNIDFDKFDDPDFNPFETKSKVENKVVAAPAAPVMDKFDDPNFNPFETKSKVAMDSTTTEKLEDTSPVQLDKTQTKKEHVPTNTTATVPNLNISAESEQFHSAESENDNSFGDENHDPNTHTATVEKPTQQQQQLDDPVARAKAKLAQFFESDIVDTEKGRTKLARNIKSQKEADNKRNEEAKAKVKAETTLNSTSNVGAFVEHVQGEALRYTARDMEIIRRQARIQAEGNNVEVDELRQMLTHYEDVVEHMRNDSVQKSSQMASDLASAIEDRDALQEDMQSLDKSYNDLQARYCRLRSAIDDMRANEQRLKLMCQQHEQRMINEQERYRVLNESSKKELRKASDQLDTIEEKKNKEISRKDAEIRIAKSKVAALQSQLDQKTAENLELVAICDQLMEGNK